MTTNLDIDKVTEFWSEDQLARIPLIDKYAGRNLENLQVDAESGYVTVVFKDTLHETIVFKYDTTTREVAEEIENELHRIMHEITEDNEQELLQGVFTLWLLNGRLTYFAQFTDIEVDTSQTYTVEVPEGEPDVEVAQGGETGT